MPTPTPALREPPSTLFAAGGPSLFPPPVAKAGRGGGEFASILKAQKPRPSQANSAYEAQHSPSASERDAQTRAANAGAESRRASEAKDDGDDGDADADVDAERIEASEREDDQPAVRDESEDRRALQVDSEAQALVAVQAQVAGQSAEQLQGNVDATAGESEAGNQSLAKPVIANESASAANEEGHDGQQAAAAQGNARAEDRSDLDAAHSQLQRQTELAVNGQTREREPQANAQELSDDPNDLPEAAKQAKPVRTADAREVVIKAAETPVDASRAAVRASNKSNEPVVQETAGDLQRSGEKHAGKSSRRVNAPEQQAIAASHASKAAEETDMQRATRDAIDALLNETQSGSAERSSPPVHAGAESLPSGRESASPFSARAAATVATAASPSVDTTAALSANIAPAASHVTTGHAAVGITAGGAGEMLGASENADGTAWMTRSDHAAGRILRGMSAMIHQNGGTMTMRLDPPELGSLRIQMTLNNGSVSASFSPGSDAARGLLEQHMGQLKTALESQGLLVDRLTIHSASSGSTNAHTGQQHGTDGRGGGEQQSQYADAGQGESRGRGEQHGGGRRPAREFFDPASLMNDAQPFALQGSARTERRISA